MGAVWDEVVRSVEHTDRLWVDWGPWWARRREVDPWDHVLYASSAGRSCWDACCERSIVDIDLAPWPEQAVVGPYLRILQRRSRIDPLSRAHPALLERCPPLRCVDLGTVSDDLCYVDIDRAYHQLYSRMTLDVSYDGVGPPRPGEIPFADVDELIPLRLARNALMGTLRRTRRNGLDHGRHFEELVPPWRRRPDLWGLVMDCLALCAIVALDCGAVYVHTDGYILDGITRAERLIERLSDVGVRASLRSRGPGRVDGLGHYVIGDVVRGSPGAHCNPVDRIHRDIPAASLASILSATMLP